MPDPGVAPVPPPTAATRSKGVQQQLLKQKLDADAIKERTKIREQASALSKKEQRARAYEQAAMEQADNAGRIHRKHTEEAETAWAMEQARRDSEDRAERLRRGEKRELLYQPAGIPGRKASRVGRAPGSSSSVGFVPSMGSLPSYSSPPGTSSSLASDMTDATGHRGIGAEMDAIASGWRDRFPKGLAGGPATGSSSSRAGLGGGPAFGPAPPPPRRRVQPTMIGSNTVVHNIGTGDIGPIGTVSRGRGNTKAPRVTIVEPPADKRAKTRSPAPTAARASGNSRHRSRAPPAGRLVV